MFKPSNDFLLTDPRWVFEFYVSCLSLLICCLVCSLQPCGHLLGKGWPLDSLGCCVFITFPYVSWSTSELRVRLVPLNMFKPSSNFLLIFYHIPKWCCFCGSFLLFVFHVCLCYAVLSVPCSLVIMQVTSWPSCLWCFLVFLSLSLMVSLI